MMGEVVDLTGRLAIRSCGAVPFERPNVAAHGGVVQRLNVGPSCPPARMEENPGRREGDDFSWRRRSPPNSAEMPANMGDDSLPTPPSHGDRQQPHHGNSMKTWVSRILAESQFKIGCGAWAERAG